MRRRQRSTVLAVVIAAFSGASLLAAEGTATPAEAQQRKTGYRPLGPAAQQPVDAHPLDSVLQYARREQAYLRNTVRDFTCRLVKRERIDDYLQDHQYIDMRVREEVREGDRVLQPLSIYLYFVGPKSVAGRQILYIDGRNDGKMMVRNGGRHFDYVVVNIDPASDTAKDESLIPITKTGFNQILAEMIAILERHARVDPTGANTKVERIEGAKLNHRPCTVVRIKHPAPQKGLEFHLANVFVDQELHVPVRVDLAGWPKRATQPPPLIAEYTYTDLKINVDLPDSAFSTSQLKRER